MIWWLTACSGTTGNTNQNAARLSIQMGEVPFEVTKEPGLNSDTLRSIEAAIGERNIVGGIDAGTHWAPLANSDEILIGVPRLGEVKRGTLSELKTTPLIELDTLYSSSPSVGFGTALAISRNDSLNRIIVGSPYDGFQDGGWDKGSIRIFQPNTTEADLILTGENNGDSLGERIFGCADLDKDGVTDWIAASSMASANSVNWTGRIHWGLSRTWAELNGTGPVSQIHETSGLSLGDRFGYWVHCAHDIDGDGITDTLVGAPFADHQDTEASGSITIFRSYTDPADLALDNTRRTLSGLESNDWLGWSIHAGDIDGDGRPEVIGGAPGALSSTGEALIWFGSDLQSQTEPLPRIRLQGQEPGDSFGRSVLIADHNGDGYGDAIVGAPTTTIDGNIGAGSVYVFFGSNGFMNWLPIIQADLADVVENGENEGKRTGQWIGAADLDNNGADDLLLLYRE